MNKTVKVRLFKLNCELKFVIISNFSTAGMSLLHVQDTLLQITDTRRQIWKRIIS